VSEHKPVYLDGEPIGCAATKEQVIALLGDQLGASKIAVTETSTAFHATRRARFINTHGLT
jgi:hypothetical protein